MKKTRLASTAKGSSTRERIVAEARKKLIKQGIEGFGLRDLAAQLDLKLSNVQYYFKNRETLVLAVLEAEAARDLAAIRAHQEKWNRAEEALHGIVRELVIRWRGDTRVLLSTLVTLALHNKAYNKLYRSFYADFYRALKAPLQHINPKLGESEVDMRVRLITALIDGSPMQTGVENVELFIDRVQEQAEQIALA